MRVDTSLCSTYWEDGKLLSMHTNAIVGEIEPSPTGIRHIHDNSFKHTVVMNGEPITMSTRPIYGTVDLSTGIVEITK